MYKINHAAVWVCVVIIFVTAYLWYGPLYGDTWTLVADVDRETIEANPPGFVVWLTYLMATVIPLYTLAYLFKRMEVSSGLEGFMLGLVMGFSFILLSRMTSNIFTLQPYRMAWITGGYATLAMAISGYVLGAWRKKA